MAFGVLCSGLWGVVPLGAVGLDDEVVLGPAEVGDDAATVEAQGDVDVGWCEAGGAEQVIDAVFQLAAGGGRLGGQDAGEARAAGAPGGAVELAGETPEVRQAHRLRAAHRPCQGAVLQPGRHVQQQPLRGRGGDAAVTPDVLGMQAAGAVHADALGRPASPEGHGDLRQAILHGQQPEQHHQGRVAEQPVRSAGLHRRQPPALGRQAGVADGVDAAVEAVQPSRGRPSPDGRLAEPAVEQLIEAQHPQLFGRPLGDQRVRFPSICGGRRTHPPSVPAPTSQNSTRLQHLTRPAVPPSAPGRRGGRGGRP